MPSSSVPPAPTEWVGVSSLGRKYEIISCICYGVAFVAVVFRVISRLQQFGRLFVDDYMCLLAQLFAFGMVAIAIIFAEKFAIGWHTDLVPLDQLVEYLKLFYAAEICYTMVSVFYKLAVVFLYQRIFGEVRAFKIASWIAVAISVCWTVSQEAGAIFQCTPIKKAWLPETPGHCINTQDYILGNGIINLLMDVAILFMPLPIIWRLNLNWQKKLAICGMFGLGAIVCIASILRISTIIPVDYTDATHSLYGIALWSNIELAVGIFAACLPTLRQYFFSSSVVKPSVVSSASRWLSSAGFSRGDGKSGLNSVARSETAVALTGWTSKSMYAEVASPANYSSPSSGQETPAQRMEKGDREMEIDVENPPPLPTASEHGSVTPQLRFGHDNKTGIHVSQEISISYD